MRRLSVDLPGRGHEILIDRGLLDRAGEQIRAVCPEAERLFVVTDTNVAPLYLSRLSDSLEEAGLCAICLTVPAGEASKSVEQLAVLWEWMIAGGMARTDAVVALGGGVVGDLAGFAAATILRGVDSIQVPTTLLAQVDSSVGGKTAIDLAHGKNLAGAFWQPKLVLMDPAVLETLPDAVFSDGMAEVVKYGCVFDRGLFDLLRVRPSREAVMAEIERILYTCCDLKRRVVVSDERDMGARMLLNFGHTLGHAFERAGGYRTWTHGQAVAAGMVVAMELSVRLGAAESDDGLRALPALLDAFHLPTHIDCDWREIEEAVAVDKKSVGTRIRLILLEKIGRAVIREMEKEEVLQSLEAIWGR